MFTYFRDGHFGKQTALFILVLSLLAVFGIWLLLYSTPYGLGLNDDSIAYIAGARSILNGQGFREAWLASNGPMTHFPPGFPGMLVLIDLITNLDPVRGARALNAVLFGLNVGLTGWLGWRMTDSRIFGLLTAALTLSSSPLLYVHSRAMSEPLYICLTLLSFLLLDWHFERSRSNTVHTLSLVILGFVLGWAYLTRYAALSLLATVLVVLLVLHNNWHKRLRSIGIMTLSAVPWIFSWSIRNRLVGGSFTNRTLGWHPITVENWELGVVTFSEFLVPYNIWRNRLVEFLGVFESILIAIGIILLVWVLINGYPRFLMPSQAPAPRILTFSNALYVIIYLAVLFTVMTLFDPATKFQVRILSPTYISLILLLVTSGAWLWREKRVLWKPLVTLSALGLLVVFAYSQFEFIYGLRQSGGTFAKEKWSESEAIAAIQQLPEDIIILSNEPGLVYLYTDRPSGVLPKTEPGISNLKQPVLDGQIVIVLFRVNNASPDALRYFHELGSGLYQTDFSNTWIFSAFPK